jgi:hypothetical protein
MTPADSRQAVASKAQNRRSARAEQRDPQQNGCPGAVAPHVRSPRSALENVSDAAPKLRFFRSRSRSQPSPGGRTLSCKHRSPPNWEHGSSRGNPRGLAPPDPIALPNQLTTHIFHSQTPAERPDLLPTQSPLTNPSHFIRPSSIDLAHVMLRRAAQPSPSPICAAPASERSPPNRIAIVPLLAAGRLRQRGLARNGGPSSKCLICLKVEFLNRQPVGMGTCVASHAC